MINDKEFSNLYATSIQESLEQIVESHKNKTAVLFGDNSLTYYELNIKVNKLSNYLKKHGINKGKRVVIVADRCIESIIGILATIKAGAVYVPVDPSYPIQRINYIIRDSNAVAVLVSSSFNSLDYCCTVINLSEINYLCESTQNPKNLCTLNDLVYISYTSGTTGVPKGVAIEHSAILRLQNVAKTILCINEHDTVAQFSTMASTASVSELFFTFLCGATLCIMPYELVLEPRKFEKSCVKNKVSVLLVSPRFYMEINLPNLKKVITVGESPSSKLLKHIPDGVDYFNLYGSTESGGVVLCWKYDKKSMIYDKLPIGKVVENICAYIIDGMQLCETGQIGEICISGAGLARGYLNNTKLTSEKFIRNPYGEGMLYRTGDLGRWLVDGNIEYLGRIDEQMKIRGFRVELGEIDSVLRKIDYIKNCAVIAKVDKSGEQAIYAYIVSDQKINMVNLRNSLSQLLPDYMIPAYMKQIESIPITQNGKLDKKALPVIDGRYENENNYIAPSNKTEQLLTEIFEEVLCLDKVGIQDNFFQIGGHSLRAMRLVNQVELQVGYKLQMKDVFNNPTIEKLCKLIEKDIFKEYSHIPKANKKDYYPMSSVQKRIYFISKMDVGTSYNMPECIKLYGDVDIKKIKDTFQKIIDRHEILRTEFLIINGEPVQRIRKKVMVDFRYIENCSTSEENLQKAFIKPFNMDKAPMLRQMLVKRDNHFILMMDMHHIIGDGMSIVTLIKEFDTIYNCEDLADLNYQYKDYSEWMRTRDFSSQKDFWLNEFKGEIPILNIPFDYARPREQSYKGEIIRRCIDKDLSLTIKKIAFKTQTTEYMVFLSILMILLSKYSRQDDIIIGSPISARIHKDTENMLGMFANTLAMRGRPEEKKKYSEFLAEIKESCLKAFENQEYPLEELIESIEIQRDISRNPLFDVMLVMQNNEPIKINLNGLKSEIIEINSNISKFDMTFNISEKDDKFYIDLEYCTDLIKAESAQTIIAHYIELIKQFLSDINIEIKKVLPITEEEKKTILECFNDTDVTFPQENTIIEMFEKQVRKTPDNIAVVFEDKQITYSELNIKANHLAYRLRDLGVGPDDFVVIIANRSIEMIVGIYGVLKAGGAYVPIANTYPEERIMYMVEDCRPKAILVFETLINVEEIPTIDLEDYKNCVEILDNPKNISSPDNLIYCLYTSGTTGKPKGVIVKHRGLLNVINWLQKEYPITENDALLLKTIFTFDVSASEIFWWCIVGAKLIVLETGDEKDYIKIVEMIEKYQVSIVNFVPSMFSVLLDGLESNITLLEKFKNLKYVILAGEVLKSEVVSKFYYLFQKLMFATKIVNLYGPTEASIYSTYYNCEKFSHRIPIGKPISNTQIYILNGTKMCGIGVQGELCIDGAGLARGYLNNTKLTSEKFIDNPYGDGRLYRSGDLCRWLPDGNIEYLGRIDEQVKIRGFRIELQEIECALLNICYIKECVVLARENIHGEKLLHAYIVSDIKVNITTIKQEIKNKLPDYMIPSYIFQVDKIPVTENGKVNKKVLPKINDNYNENFSPPNNRLEKLICDIFSKVLNVKRVGRYDDFFNLGGHSILAIKFSIEMEKHGYGFEVKDLFNYTKVYEIAKFLNNEKIDLKSYTSLGSTQSINYHENQCSEKKIRLDNIKGYNEVYFKSCFYNALFPAFIYYRKNLYNIFIYEIPTYKIDYSSKLISNEYISSISFKENLQRIGIELNIINENKDIVSKLINLLRSGRPVIVQIDCFYSPIRIDTYNKIHWPHSILVYGFDLERGIFHIIEHNHRDTLTYMQKEISFFDLEKAYYESIERFGKNIEEPPFVEICNIDTANDEDSIDKQRKIMIDNIIANKETLKCKISELDYISDSILRNWHELKNSNSYLQQLLDNLNKIIEAKKIETLKFNYIHENNLFLKDLVSEIQKTWEKVRINLVRELLKQSGSSDFNLEYYIKKIVNMEMEYLKFFTKSRKDNMAIY